MSIDHERFTASAPDSATAHAVPEKVLPYWEEPNIDFILRFEHVEAFDGSTVTTISKTEYILTPKLTAKFMAAWKAWMMRKEYPNG